MIVSIIGAMECEISKIKEQINEINVSEIAMMKFYSGILYNVKIVVVCCGIGKVNSAIGTQLLIDKFNVDFVINIGVAGALSEELGIGDVVISSEVTYHDFNPMQLVKSYPWMPDIFIKADEKLINLSQMACEHISLIKRTHIGRIISGDRFISNTEEKKQLYLKLSALCVECEGASVAHVCYVNKMPFVIIRSISDKANEAASISFREFLKTASEQSNKIIISVLQLIENNI